MKNMLFCFTCNTLPNSNEMTKIMHGCYYDFGKSNKIHSIIPRPEIVKASLSLHVEHSH